MEPDLLLQRELGARQFLKLFKGIYQGEESLFMGAESARLLPLIRPYQTWLKSLESLSHSNWLPYRGLVEYGDKLFFRHSWVESRPFSNFLREVRTLSVPQALQSFLQMLEVMSFLHSHSLVHGFLTPASFVITPDEKLLLMDFPCESLLKRELIRSGAELPYRAVLYSAPEVIASGDVQKESDYFSLGAMLYTFLTGKHPFSDQFGRPSQKLLLEGSRTEENEEMEHFPAGLRGLLDTLLSFEPNKRSLDPMEVRGAVKVLLAESHQRRFRTKITVKKATTFMLRSFFWAFFLSLLLGIGAIILGFYRFFLASPDRVKVPNLFGKDSVEAKALLGPMGLKLTVQREEYSTHQPKGYIISQEPHAGLLLSRGQEVKVVLSKGNPIIRIPDVKDYTLEDAQSQLERMGLKAGNIRYVSSNLPRGWVVGQSPAPWTEARAGSSVDLEVSSGGEEVSLPTPDVTGKDADTAESTLRSQGLVLREITWVYRKDVTTVKVVSQVPKPGEMVSLNTAVSITVEKSAKDWGESFLRIRLPEIKKAEGNTEEVALGRLTIFQQDKLGKRVLHDKKYAGGVDFFFPVSFQSDAVFEVYWNEELIRKEEFRWQASESLP